MGPGSHCLGPCPPTVPAGLGTSLLQAAQLLLTTIELVANADGWREGVRCLAGRQPGLLRGQLQLPSIDVLLAPLPPEELDALEAPLPWPEPEGRHVGLVRLQLLQDRRCLSVGLIGKALMPLRWDR